MSNLFNKYDFSSNQLEYLIGNEESYTSNADYDPFHSNSAQDYHPNNTITANRTQFNYHLNNTTGYRSTNGLTHNPVTTYDADNREVDDDIPPTPYHPQLMRCNRSSTNTPSAGTNFHNTNVPILRSSNSHATRIPSHPTPPQPSHTNYACPHPSIPVPQSKNKETSLYTNARQSQDSHTNMRPLHINMQNYNPTPVYELQDSLTADTLTIGSGSAYNSGSSFASIQTNDTNDIMSNDTSFVPPSNSNSNCIPNTIHCNANTMNTFQTIHSNSFHRNMMNTSHVHNNNNNNCNTTRSDNNHPFHHTTGNMQSSNTHPYSIQHRHRQPTSQFGSCGAQVVYPCAHAPLNHRAVSSYNSNRCNCAQTPVHPNCNEYRSPPSRCDPYPVSHAANTIHRNDTPQPLPPSYASNAPLHAQPPYDGGTMQPSHHETQPQTQAPVAQQHTPVLAEALDAGIQNQATARIIATTVSNVLGSASNARATADQLMDRFDIANILNNAMTIHSGELQIVSECQTALKHLNAAFQEPPKPVQRRHVSAVAVRAAGYTEPDPNGVGSVLQTTNPRPEKNQNGADSAKPNKKKQTTRAVVVTSNQIPSLEPVSSPSDVLPDTRGKRKKKINKFISTNEDSNGGYKCKKCGKIYKYICNLRSHAKIHTDDAHICEFCNKRFGRRANYIEHKRIHTGEMPFKCSICNKGFKQRYGWKDHMKTHVKQTLKRSKLKHEQ